MSTPIELRKTFKPRNPDYQQRVRSSFERQGAMALIAAQLSRIGPGEIDIQVPFQEQLSQQHGFYHGGILAMVADSACGYAAFSLMPADAAVLTIEFKTNFLAPAEGELLIACGRVIKPGRTINVSHADVLVRKQGKDYLCATMTATNMTVYDKVKE